MAQPDHPFSEINQKAIAKLLNLSTATVSRSLRNDEAIRATTRARVFQAAQQLGYRIPEAKRGRVRTRPIRTLQLLVGSATGLGPAGDEIISGISEAATAYDSHLSVFVSPASSRGSLEGEHEPPAMRAGLVGGAILLHSFPPAVVAGLVQRLPVVSMVHRFAGLPVDCVDTDEPRAVVDLFRLLRRAGHQRVGFVDWNGTKSWEQARFAGYREALFLHDQELDRALVLSLRGDVSTHDEVAEQVRAHRDRGVTAWICACDPIAYSLIGRLRRLGLEPGRDIAIAGFDGLKPPAGEEQIPTVRVPYRDLGVAAVRRLAHRIESPHSRIRDILLRHDLVPSYLAADGITGPIEAAGALPPPLPAPLPASLPAPLPASLPAPPDA